ncbi:hypothetical protein [Thalassoglobus sp.]|uniref:hypothetical protein n=1 Tax=Thalassoglobus sp. TaxID=2795869 RepID=UPI003AA8B177
MKTGQAAVFRELIPEKIRFAHSPAFESVILLGVPVIPRFVSYFLRDSLLGTP